MLNNVYMYMYVYTACVFHADVKMRATVQVHHMYTCTSHVYIHVHHMYITCIHVHIKVIGLKWNCPGITGLSGPTMNSTCTYKCTFHLYQMDGNWFTTHYGPLCSWGGQGERNH